MFTTRRKPARTFSPSVDGLEARKLLSSGAGLAKANFMAPAEIRKMAPVTEVQKVREAYTPSGHTNIIAILATSKGKMVPAVEIKHAPASVQGGHVGTPAFVTSDLNPQPLPPGVRPEEPKNMIRGRAVRTRTPRCRPGRPH
jgi:hypothetical protein